MPQKPCLRYGCNAHVSVVFFADAADRKTTAVSRDSLNLLMCYQCTCSWFQASERQVCLNILQFVFQKPAALKGMCGIYGTVIDSEEVPIPVDVMSVSLKWHWNYLLVVRYFKNILWEIKVIVTIVLNVVLWNKVHNLASMTSQLSGSQGHFSQFICEKWRWADQWALTWVVSH